MPGLKLGRPWTAIAGGVLAIVGTLITLCLLSLGLTILSEEGYSFSASDILDVVYSFVWCGLVLLGGSLILTRRYIAGGALAFLFSIPITIGLWYLGIWGLIGGVLGLVSKEKTAKRVLEMAKLYGSIGIGDLASKVGKTEADVELALIELQSKGRPIRFDAETREVTYLG